MPLYTWINFTLLSVTLLRTDNFDIISTPFLKYFLFSQLWRWNFKKLVEILNLEKQLRVSDRTNSLNHCFINYPIFVGLSNTFFILVYCDGLVASTILFLISVGTRKLKTDNSIFLVKDIINIHKMSVQMLPLK